MKNRAIKIIVSISAAAPAFAAAIALAQRLPHKAAIPAGLAAALLTAALVFAFLRKKDLSPRFKDLPKRPETAFYAFFLEAVCSAASLSAGSYVSGSWKGSVLASALHISRTGLGYLIAGLIAAAALPAVIFACVSFTGRAAERPSLSPKLRGFAYSLLLLLIPVIWHVILQYSCLKKISELSLMRWYMFALGTAFLLALELLLIALSGRLRLPAAVLSVSVSVWSLANYYVVLYHGSPLFISTLASARTAAGVLSGYKVTLPPNAVSILALFALEICLSLMLPKRLSPEGRGKAPAKLRALAGASALVLACAFFFCVSDRDIMPENTMGWFWGVGVDEYGYIACNYEDASNRLRPLAVPEGYSPEAVNGIPLNGRTAASEEHPDIIIILNESFYDLSVYSDMEFDRDYLKSFYSIEGAHCGFACKPRQGTTNNAEMELLTSNSMALLPLEAPFNYFDFTEYRHSLADDLIVSGYSTAAMHVNRTN
ncbi:MAG: hypothetical protein IJM17_09685 [Firmicutes bacterium]|nr:hypothetical protein [Bacillota bacterium]